MIRYESYFHKHGSKGEDNWWTLNLMFLIVGGGDVLVNMTLSDIQNLCFHLRNQNIRKK